MITIIMLTTMTNTTTSRGSEESHRARPLLEPLLDAGEPEDRSFAMCLLLEVPIRGSPYHMRSFETYQLCLGIRYFPKEFI